MHKIIENIRKKAKTSDRTIILPEGKDSRVRQAAKIIEKEKVTKLILLDGNNLGKEKIEKFTEQFYQLRKHKQITIDQARQAITQPVYFAAMMVRNGEADGFVAGASHTTPDVAKAAIYCLGVDRKYGTISSCFIMVHPDESFGDKGIFLFADCGIVPDPSPKQLASIAASTAELGNKVLDVTPRIAMLSYSSKGSAKGKLVDKVKSATDLVKASNPDLIVDGELQVDSAIIPEVAKIKNPDGIIKGDANILIFPDLEAGNIGYKLVNRLAKVRAVGPLLMGLNNPCSDLSRGCSIDDIVDTVAVTAIRAAKEK